MQYSRFYSLFIFFTACLLYVNTLGHSYTQDDNMLIENNKFTHQGFEGLYNVFAYDTFYGHFKDSEDTANMVSGGRYRPLTHAMFTIEYEFFGKNPFIGHFINMLLYALLCVLIYYTLLKLLQDYFKDKPHFKAFVFFATLLYTIHPLHTEAVANIKGRDEIAAMLFSMLALNLALQWLKTQKVTTLISVVVVFFLGLLSKENTVTFLAIIPLATWMFYKVTLKQNLTIIGGLLVSTVGFLLLRYMVIGPSFGETSQIILNNPYLKQTDGNLYIPFTFFEKYATITYTLGAYIKLFFIPHPLTYDYYPKHIDMKSFADVSVLISLVIYAIIIAITIWGIKKKHLLGFAFFFFIASLSIVSNIVFPIGTHMSERFMFMPSLGLCLAVTYGLWYIVQRKSWQAPALIFGVIAILFCVKTITRNTDWKDNFTLFTTDVITSKNSAKGTSAAAAVILTKIDSMPRDNTRKRLYYKAETYLKRAQDLVPSYWSAFMIEGFLHTQEQDTLRAALAFEKAYQMDTTRVEAKNNYASAILNLSQVHVLAGNNEEAKRLRKIAFSMGINMNDLK